MSSALAVVLGAVISGLVGILVVFYQQRLAGRHEVDIARGARLSEFSAVGWTATLMISELARAPMSQKAAIKNAPRYEAHIDQFNLALAQIQLLDNGDVYITAHRIHACLVTLERQALSRQFDRTEWHDRRVPLALAVADYQRAGRADLKSPAIVGQEPWLERAMEQQHSSTDRNPAAN